MRTQGASDQLVFLLSLRAGSGAYPGGRPLTKLDSQPAAPPPAVTEMRSFKRIAEIVSENLSADIRNVDLGRANHSFFLEQVDAGGEVEDRARPYAATLEVHEFGARRGFQLLEPILFDLQRRTAFVPSGEAEQ